MVLNALRRSMKNTPVTNPWSIFLSHLSVTFSSAGTIECNFLKPDCAMLSNLSGSTYCVQIVLTP